MTTDHAATPAEACRPSRDGRAPAPLRLGAGAAAPLFATRRRDPQALHSSPPPGHDRDVLLIAVRAMHSVPVFPCACARCGVMARRSPRPVAAVPIGAA